MRKKNRKDRTPDRLHRILAGLLAAMMICGLVVGSGSAVPVRAAEAEAVEAPVEEKAPEKASAEKEEKKAAEKVEEKTAEEKQEAPAEQPASEAASLQAAEPEKEDASEPAAATSEEKKDEVDPSDNVAEVEASEEQTEEEQVPETVNEAEESVEDSRAFAEMSAKEQYEALWKMSDEEAEAAVATLTQEQIDAILQYAQSLEKHDPPKTVVFVKAGPFISPIASVKKSARKLLGKAPLRAKSSDAPEGLEISKKATVNDDGTYTLTLESYTTGEVTSQETSVPVDIVLVLDQSGSMNDDFNGNSTNNYNNTRQKAMIDAVQNFIYNVNEKYDADSADHRIAIVKFAGDKNNAIGDDTYTRNGYTYNYSQKMTDGFLDVRENYDSLKGIVGGLTARGATHADYGMEHAADIIDSAGDDGRIKVVIMFTDGVPTSSDEFDLTVANGAINAAKRIKDQKATVYTVGIFNGADVNELYGTKSYLTHTSNGVVNSYWDVRRGLFTGGDLEAADIPAGNRFLNYLSSNFASATSIGLKEHDTNHFVAYYNGWEITKNFDRTTSGYYLTANNAASLDNVFKSIAQQISTPTISLGSETVIKDIISPQFQLPENATVKFYTQAYQGNDSWAARTAAPSSVKLVQTGDSKNVSVTGFDFNENCVTEDAKEDGSHGKKLIIEITVEPDPNFLGGNVKTNDDESGIVTEDGQTIAHFTVDPVDVPLKKIEAQLTDKNIYLSTEDKLADLFNKADQTFKVSNADGSNEHVANFSQIFNGENNAAVDVTFEIYDGDTKIESFTIPHGETSGDWSSDEPPVLTKDTYTIKCVITDATNLDNKTVGSNTAKINVFKPILTYEDKNVYYKGTQIPVSRIAPSKIEWKHGETLDSAVTMDTTKPTLTFTYSGITEGTVDQTTDYTVGVTKIMSDAQEDYDILTKAADAAAFKRDCKTEEGDWPQDASKDEAFKIHVYTPSLAFEDMEKYYGEEIDIDAQKPSADSLKWKNGDTEAPARMDNTKPQVTVELTPAVNAVNENGYVAVTEDFDVAAKVKIGDTDITSTLIDNGAITRTCDIDGQSCGENPSVSATCAFVVHVKTVTLDVTKQIEGAFADKTAKYSFTVTVTPAEASGLQQVMKTQELGDGDKLEMDELPKGASVTVTEAAVPENYTVTAKLNDQDATVSGTTVTGTLTADENHVVVTNKLNYIPITGVDVPVIYLELMIAGSAALGIALIACAARRKKEARSR